MSVFPKRVVKGDDVVIHNAFHLKHFNEGIYHVLLEINILCPTGERINVFNRIIKLIKLSSEEDTRLAEENKKNNYKYTPLQVLGNYFSSNDAVEEITTILSAIPSGKHFYHAFAIPDSFPAGKYYVEAIHYIDGEKFYSKNNGEDFFYVEHISIEYKNNTIRVINTSPQSCPVKYLTRKVNDTGYACITEVLKPYAIKEMATGTMDYLQYNEDRITIPLYHNNALIPIRNPKLSYSKMLTKEGVVVFCQNKKDAYELEGEYYTIWALCDGNVLKEQIVSLYGITAYTEMVAAQLILEQIQ